MRRHPLGPGVTACRGSNRDAKPGTIQEAWKPGGQPPDPRAPLTGVCAVCDIRARVRKDGKMWSHRRIPEKPGVCQGAGTDPKSGTVRQEWPIRKATPARFLSQSVRAVSGGLPSLGRRK
jgi:hypothetical protein